MGKETSNNLKTKDVERLLQLDAEYNRVHQKTPLGSLTYSGNTATTTLTPQQQALLEQQQITQLLAGQTAEGRLQGFGTSGDAVQQGVFDRAMSLLSPEFARREESLRQRLANQGLPQSSAGFNAELGRFDDSYNRALQDAATSAVLAGSQEQTAELNRILGLLQGGQVSMPQFANVPQVTAPVATGQGQKADPLSLILGLGGGALGAYFGGPAGATAGYQIGSGAGQAFQGR